MIRLRWGFMTSLCIVVVLLVTLTYGVTSAKSLPTPMRSPALHSVVGCQKCDGSQLSWCPDGEPVGCTGATVYICTYLSCYICENGDLKWDCADSWNPFNHCTENNSIGPCGKGLKWGCAWNGECICNSSPPPYTFGSTPCVFQDCTAD
jgi:hypothetical protein